MSNWTTNALLLSLHRPYPIIPTVETYMARPLRSTSHAHVLTFAHVVFPFLDYVYTDEIFPPFTHLLLYFKHLLKIL